MLNFDFDFKIWKYFFIVIIVISQYVDMNPTEKNLWKYIFQLVK